MYFKMALDIDLGLVLVNPKYKFKKINYSFVSVSRNAEIMTHLKEIEDFNVQY